MTDTQTQIPFTLRQTHVGPNFFRVLWVFTVLSIAGLIGETLQHFVAFGEWESRAGFIWGPFSPIYGTAAALLTWILEPISNSCKEKSQHGWLVIFVVSAIVGGGVEYLCSYLMETYWGIVAWSYLQIPFNFDGRTDLFHMILWGGIGTLWVVVGLPFADWCFKRLNIQSVGYRAVSVVLCVFIVANSFMTISCMMRSEARTQGVPAASAFDSYLDENYPDELLQSRFNNMGGIGQP